MRQAIQTHYFGPTNTRPAKIKAGCEAKIIFVPWDHSLGIDDNHIAAARKLAAQLGWSGQWFGGGLPGSGFAFVQKDAPDGDFIVGDRP